MEMLPRAKAELLREERDAAAEMEATLDRFTDEQITNPRDQGGWSIQDHLNHLIDWETSAAMLLEHRSLDERLAALGLDKATAMKAGEDEENAILRARWPRTTAVETRAALRTSHERLLRAIEPLSDADLQADYSNFQPEVWGGGNGKPVMSWVVGNSSGHYREHLPWITEIAARGGRQARGER